MTAHSDTKVAALHVGGVFEEAIATANLLLHGGQQIAQTVRTAAFVDNTWKVSPCLSCSSLQSVTAGHHNCHYFTNAACTVLTDSPLVAAQTYLALVSLTSQNVQICCCY